MKGRLLSPGDQNILTPINQRALSKVKRQKLQGELDKVQGSPAKNEPILPQIGHRSPWHPGALSALVARTVVRQFIVGSSLSQKKTQM